MSLDYDCTTGRVSWMTVFRRMKEREEKERAMPPREASDTIPDEEQPRATRDVSIDLPREVAKEIENVVAQSNGLFTLTAVRSLVRQQAALAAAEAVVGKVAEIVATATDHLRSSRAAVRS